MVRKTNGNWLGNHPPIAANLAVSHPHLVIPAKAEPAPVKLAPYSDTGAGESRGDG